MSSGRKAWPWSFCRRRLSCPEVDLSSTSFSPRLDISWVIYSTLVAVHKGTNGMTHRSRCECKVKLYRISLVLFLIFLPFSVFSVFFLSFFALSSFFHTHVFPLLAVSRVRVYIFASSFNLVVNRGLFLGHHIICI